MKNSIFYIIILVLLSFNLFSQGVAIVSVDSLSNSFTKFNLEKINTNISINNQISTIKTEQHFQNQTTEASGFKFAFPVPENASATQIRWKIDSVWHTASLTATIQDSSFVSSNGSSNFLPDYLENFLGNNPLYFNINESIAPNSNIVLELTYVELLPYFNNVVSFNYPGNYNLIQETIDTVSIKAKISSIRVIENVSYSNLLNWDILSSDNLVEMDLNLEHFNYNTSINFDYLLQADNLEFYSFSNYYPDSLLICDSINGFFTFIVEPNSNINNDIIPKDFVIIIDRSGSMSGDKISQAKQAASFIIDNLNVYDKFNIVAFDDVAIKISPNFLENTISNKNLAHNFINNITANSSTNISGAFDAALPLFLTSDNERVKNIIFLTDGEASAGITETNQLLNHISTKRILCNQNIVINVFGIGSSVNHYLLALIASQNNGIFNSIENENINQEISQFYSLIQNPVLINTTLSFDSPDIVEVYPNPIPNLYKGQQLIISGRYSNSGIIDVNMSGYAFGSPVTYNYTMNLSDSINEEYEFLPKIWTKSKINHMTKMYYENSNNTSAANLIRNEIQRLSVCRNVSSPFTSFTYSNPNLVEMNELELTNNELFQIYPNPCESNFTLKFDTKYKHLNIINIKIYSLNGKLVFSSSTFLNENMEISINLENLDLRSGVYTINVSNDEVNLNSLLYIF